MKIIGKITFALITSIILIFLASRFFKFQIPGFGTKITSWDTAVQLEAILDINQLVTAEFHGETICTDCINPIITDNDKYLSHELQKYNKIYTAIRNSINQIIDYREYKGFDGNELQIENFYVESYQSAIRNKNDKDSYDQLMEILGGKKKFLSKVLKTVNANSWHKQYFFKEHKYQYDNQIESNVSRFKKKLNDSLNMAYLARGVIVSGIEIGDSIKRDSSIDEDFIRINGKIKILETVINPWMVPGKVNGFEPLNLKNKKPDISKVIKLKTNCEVQLRNEAISKEIKIRALENAEHLLNEIYLGNERIVLVDNDVFDFKYEAISIDGFLDEIEFENLFSFLDFWSNIENFDKCRYSSFDEQKGKIDQLKIRIKDLITSNKLIGNKKYILLFGEN